MACPSCGTCWGPTLLKWKRWVRCECCSSTERLTAHHCHPRAARKGSIQRVETVTLCEKCHATLHNLWGPGDNYKGPRDAKGTLDGLRDHIRAHEEAQAEI